MEYKPNFTLNEGDRVELARDLTAEFNAHIILFEENKQ
jgi:putative ubiquitin-RnfH superfamily antitoxin RatB of RatAB toxin-antitoxin module